MKTPKEMIEEVEREIENLIKKIRNEFVEVKNQHEKKIKREWGKLVNVEMQRERDIIEDINENINIIKLQTRKQTLIQAFKSELEFLEIMDKDNAISLNKDYNFKVKERIQNLKEAIGEGNGR